MPWKYSCYLQVLDTRPHNINFQAVQCISSATSPRRIMAFWLFYMTNAIFIVQMQLVS